MNEQLNNIYRRALIILCEFIEPYSDYTAEELFNEFTWKAAMEELGEFPANGRQDN